MSIFDDIPLEIGTRYYDKVITDWNPENQKYLISSPSYKDERWLSREKVESAHGSSLLEGVEVRTAKPGNSYNTRFFRSNPN
jgi:hypothetical protein